MHEKQLMLLIMLTNLIHFEIRIFFQNLTPPAAVFSKRFISFGTFVIDVINVVDGLISCNNKISFSGVSFLVETEGFDLRYSSNHAVYRNSDLNFIL